jgi:hypothetical protein
MVASWAAHRFYDMARESSHSENMTPYLIGAGIGVAYVMMLQRRRVPLVARVPLGAAIWLGEPEKTAAPMKGGRSIPERARQMAMRMAAKSLKKAAEKVLFA